MLSPHYMNITKRKQKKIKGNKMLDKVDSDELKNDRTTLLNYATNKTEGIINEN